MRQRVSVPVGGLSTTLHPAKVGVGPLVSANNLENARGVAEGGARYGFEGDSTHWKRTSAHANDKGLGFAYFEYANRTEYIAIVQQNGESFARAFTVNPSTGTFTAITGGGSLTVSATAADNVWTFRQYEDFLYAHSVAAGAWLRRIGGAGDSSVPGYRADNEWRAFEPELVYGGAITIATDRPAYVDHNFVTGTEFLSVHPGSNYQYINSTPETDGTVVVNDGTFSETDVDTYFSAVLPAALDLQNVDYVYFLFTPVAGSPDITAGSGSGMYDPVVTAQVNEDATTVFDLTYAGGLTLAATDLEIFGGQSCHRLDLSGVSAASRDVVRRIVWRVQCKTWRPMAYSVRVILAGAKMWDVAGTSPQIEYAAAYYNPTTSQLTDAVSSKSLSGQLEGSSPLGTIEEGGAWVRLTGLENASLYAAGFTKMRFYRRSTDTDKRWVYIGEDDNGPDSDPEATDTAAESEIRAGTSVALAFGGFVAGVLPEAIGCWKQHFALGHDRKCFLSWAALPDRFTPPPEQDFTVPEESVSTQGATFYVSQGRTEPVTGFVEQDLLYIATRRGIYVVIGDSALDSTPPRLLPRSRPPVGRRGFVPFAAGALVAAQDGLWYFEATRAFNSRPDNAYDIEELTEEVRGSWKTLLGSDATGLVLAVIDDEIWAFNGTAYMRYSRPRRDPETGETRRDWTSGTWLALAGVHVQLGLPVRGMDSKGRILRFFTNSSGVAYATDEGVAANWAATWGAWQFPRRRVVAIEAMCEGAPTLTLTVDDVNLASPQGFGPFPLSADDRMVLDVNILPGTRLQMAAAGVVGTDALTEVVLVTEDYES